MILIGHRGGPVPDRAWSGRDNVVGRPVMAVARDHATRVIRPEPGTTDGDDSAGLGEQLRAHVVDETKRHPVEPAGPPPAGDPAVAPAAAPTTAAPKSGKRKFG